MLLMVEKGIKGGICHAIHQYAAANNKNMKTVIKTMNHHILCIYMEIIHMEGQCLKNYQLTILNENKMCQNLMKRL